VWYYFASIKTTKLLDDTQFQVVLESARTKLGVSERIPVYLKDEKITLLKNARTPFFHGLQVSKRTVEKILLNPVEGEIVLAHELSLLKRDHLWITFFRNLGATGYALLTEGAMLFTLFEELIPLITIIPLWLLAIILSYPWGVILLIWYQRKASAENEIESVYGKNPHIAQFHVFSSPNISDAGRRFYIDQIGSRIDIRQSRRISVSFGMPLIVSFAISIVVYGLFSIYSTPIIFQIFAALLLGGISFSLGVYHYESKGTGRLKPPDFPREPEPVFEEVDDEFTVEVKRLLCKKVGTDDCTILHYTPEMMLEDIGEEGSMLEITINDSMLWIAQEVIDVLKEPEMVSSYLYGSYTENNSGIKSIYYFYLMLISVITFFGGLLYWLFLTDRPSLYLIAWILFYIVTLSATALAINTISERKIGESLAIMLESNPNYLIALREITASSDVDPWTKKRNERSLRRIIPFVSEEPST
jgi:hypothetical protein